MALWYTVLVIFSVYLVPRNKLILSVLLIFCKKKMPTSVDFSKNFTACLKQSCLSQLELSAMTGIHKQSINRYATGKTTPNWQELLKIAEAMKCSLESFREGRLIPVSTREVAVTNPEDVSKLEQMKPIIKELGSVVNKLASFISE